MLPEEDFPLYQPRPRITHVAEMDDADRCGHTMPHAAWEDPLHVDAVVETVAIDFDAMHRTARAARLERERVERARNIRAIWFAFVLWVVAAGAVMVTGGVP